MKNPIKPETRGKLYVAAIIVGTLAVVAGPIMAALAVPTEWVIVVTTLIGAVTALLGVLARDNLTLPDEDTYQPKHLTE